jgi:RNase P subunit RPR2
VLLAVRGKHISQYGSCGLWFFIYSSIFHPHPVSAGSSARLQRHRVELRCELARLQEAASLVRPHRARRLALPQKRASGRPQYSPEGPSEGHRFAWPQSTGRCAWRGRLGLAFMSVRNRAFTVGGHNYCEQRELASQRMHKVVSSKINTVSDGPYYGLTCIACRAPFAVLRGEGANLVKIASSGYLQVICPECGTDLRYELADLQSFR